MKPKPLKQYIEEYESKTKDKFIVRKDYYIYYLPDKGFATFKADAEGKILIVEYVCGSGDFWLSFAELKCRELGLAYIGTFCNRNIDAYIKTMGGEILDEETNELGHRRILAQDKIGRKVIATFKCERGEGLDDEYYVTLYLDEKAVASLKEI